MTFAAAQSISPREATALRRHIRGARGLRVGEDDGIAPPAAEDGVGGAGGHEGAARRRRRAEGKGGRERLRPPRREDPRSAAHGVGGRGGKGPSPRRASGK